MCIVHESSSCKRNASSMHDHFMFVVVYLFLFFFSGREDPTDLLVWFSYWVPLERKTSTLKDTGLREERAEKGRVLTMQDPAARYYRVYRVYVHMYTGTGCSGGPAPREPLLNASSSSSRGRDFIGTYTKVNKYCS